MAVEATKQTGGARFARLCAAENHGAWGHLFDPGMRSSCLRAALERMRRRHLMRDGLYARLRGLVPVLSLVGVWLYASHAIRSRFNLHTFVDSSMILRHLLLIIGSALLWNMTSARRHARRNSLRRDLEIEVMLLTRGSLVCGLFIYAGTVRHLGDEFGLSLALLSTLALLASSYLLLAGTLVASAQFLKRGRGSRALIVGSGRRAMELRELAQNSHAHLEIVGCLDDEYMGSDREADRYLGKLALLPELLKAEPVEVVLIGLPVKSHYDDIQSVIDVCGSIGVECQYKHDIFETSRVMRAPSRVPLELAALGGQQQDLRHLLKRGLDITVACTLLLLAAPIMLVIALAIRLTSPGPVFFVQHRYGYHRRIFSMYKFRTMVVDAEKRQAALEHANEAGGPVFKLANDPRVTKLGSLLRRTSLDELPQLLNVLRGDMSLVGPRPLPVRDVSKFDEWWLLRRFSVPPGLTCLWQVGGRSNTKFEEWIRLDLQYIDEWSLALDLRILARTIPAVMRGSGAV